MVILVMLLLLLGSIALFITKRSRETGFILALISTLALHWMCVLTYIAKKGGISADVQTLLFGLASVRRALQYMLVTLRQLGFAMAVGRYLFPLELVWLALHYSYDPAIRSRRWLPLAAAVLPAASLVLYTPDVFEAVIGWNRAMLRPMITASLVWIIAYIVLAMLLLWHEERGITIRFYRRQFQRKCGMLASIAALYLLYCPQDPAQVYLFYRDEYMGAAQGLWYLSPALSMVNYVLVIVAVLVFSAIGFDSLMHYTQQIIREGQEDMAIERKFDVASQGASVFVHSVKNQLLANRVLLRRIGAELDKPEADVEKLREYHASLSASNAMMLERMEELYKGVKSKSIQLVPNGIADVCAAAKERFLRKYPDANLSVSIQEDVQVFCDRTHLVESIYNLLTNGWEAQAAAGRESEPLRLLVRQERLWTAIEVRDRGNGIPAEQRKHIFEPFYSSKNSNYNWGMGLYYVRSIVKSHFGILRLDTKVGEGSSFFILLPRYGRMADAQACRKDEI